MASDYLEKYDLASAHTGMLFSDIPKVALATATDVVTTLWNSLPLTTNVQTEDVLGRISEDSLRIFNENPDTIRMASLIGGSFIPGGIGVKLLNRAKAGLVSAGYGEGLIAGTLTGQRQKVLVEEMADLYKGAGAGTAEYRAASRNLYLSNAASQIVDNAAIELAVAGAMNAHPYMEDYWKDPLSNFALGTAYGAGLGVMMAFPSTRRAIKDPIGKLATEATGTVGAAYKNVDEAFTAAAQYQGRTANIERMAAIAEDESQFAVTRQLAESVRLQEGGLREKVVEDAAPFLYKMNDKGKLEVIDPELKDQIVKLLEDPRMIGVDTIERWNMDKAVSETAHLAYIDSSQSAAAAAKGGILQMVLNQGKAAAAKSGSLISSTFLDDQGKAVMAFVRPSTGEIFGARGARNAATAADLPNIKGILAAEVKANNIMVPTPDFLEDQLLRSVTSARSSSRFLVELSDIEKRDLSKYSGITVDPQDLPRMNALNAKRAKMHPDEAEKIQINVRSDIPTYQETQKVLDNIVGKDHLKKIENAIQRLSFDDIGVSAKTDQMITDFVRGSGIDKAKLRRAVDAHLRKNALPASERGNEEMGRELWNAGAKFRAELRKFADPEGYVYLYRGIDGPVAGHSAVESYSTRPNISEHFGAPKMRRISVDNIVGTVGNKRLGEWEVLVGSPHYEEVASLPTGVGGPTQMVKTGANEEFKVATTSKNNVVTLDQIPNILMDETERQVRTLMAQNTPNSKNIFSVEEISARLNVEKEAIHAMAAGSTLKDWVADTGKEWRRYFDADKIDDYLHPSNKLYGIRGNANKNAAAESMANLDARQSRIEHTEHIRQKTILANSWLGHMMLDVFEHQGMHVGMDDVMNNIGEINNILVGNHRFQSADNALRDLKSRPTIVWMGKQILESKARAIEELIQPTANTMLAAKTPVALAEMGEALNMRLGLKGWAELRIDEKTGWGYWVQRGEKGQEIPVAKGEGTYWIKQKEVLAAMQAMIRPGREILRMGNLIRSIKGQAPMSDIGFYVPPPSLVNKNIAFVIDNTGKQGTRMLTANSGPELESLVNSYKKTTEGLQPHMQVVTKADQEYFNLVKGYADFDSVSTYANSAMQHTGSSASAISPSTTSVIESVLQGFENLIVSNMNHYAEVYTSDITSWLDRLSHYHGQSVEAQPKRAATKESYPDSAKQVKNVMLGRDQLDLSPGLKAANSFTDMMLNKAYTSLNNITRSFLTKGPTTDDYNKLLADLKKNGVTPMWESYDAWAATKRGESKNVAANLVSTGNGLLATLQLRMFEIAQASVNIMSLPILTWSSLMETLPGTMINPQGDMVKFPLRAMYAGIRQMFSPEGRRLEQTIWEPRRLIDQTARQYTDTIAAIKAAHAGSEPLDKVIDAVQRFQRSDAVKLLSSPADMAERFTRRFVMHTGYWAAKQAYKDIDEIGATMAASSFADRAIGNYHAAQRPTVFQGSLGAAVGLYQTYFLTFAQHVYRGFENQNFAQLAGMAASQAGIFGISSWPGFNMLSEQVVSRFNDKHYDLTTGTFRATDKHMAELILYGLPSSLGPAFYTRGDVSPRIPSTMTEIAVVNGVKEGYNAASQIIKKVGEGVGNGTPVQSLFEALSLQSINRPIARWSELVTGQSLTKKGDTVSPQNDVWTPLGVSARLLATRPLDEQVVRNARHLDTFYGQVDTENRHHVVETLRTKIRDGKLTSEDMSNAADQYMRRGGSAKGWQSALNDAMLRADEGTRLGMLRKLESDNPVQQMIKDHY